MASISVGSLSSGRVFQHNRSRAAFGSIIDNVGLTFQLKRLCSATSGRVRVSSTLSWGCVFGTPLARLADSGGLRIGSAADQPPMCRFVSLRRSDSFPVRASVVFSGIAARDRRPDFRLLPDVPSEIDGDATRFLSVRDIQSNGWISCLSIAAALIAPPVLAQNEQDNYDRYGGANDGRPWKGNRRTRRAVAGRSGRNQRQRDRHCGWKKELPLDRGLFLLSKIL